MQKLSRERQLEVRAIRRAVAKIGGQQAMADRISKHLKRPPDKPFRQSTVSGWCTGRAPVTATLVLPIEEWTGEPCYRLRRDLYPRPVSA